MRNSAMFLEMCGSGTTYKDVKNSVQAYLDFPVTWIDCLASACMLIRWLECWHTGSTRGKGHVKKKLMEA